MSSKLIAEIARAHEAVKSGSPGARETLARLQDEYRRSGEIIRYGGTCQLSESGSSSPHPQRARPPAVERDVDRRPPERFARTSSSRPYWMLGERETWRL
jgi:hypothetical protein